MRPSQSHRHSGGGRNPDRARAALLRRSAALKRPCLAAPAARGYNYTRRGVAQLVARVVRDDEVAGSSPVTPTTQPTPSSRHCRRDVLEASRVPIQHSRHSGLEPESIPGRYRTGGFQTRLSPAPGHRRHLHPPCVASPTCHAPVLPALLKLGQAGAMATPSRAARPRHLRRQDLGAGVERSDGPHERKFARVAKNLDEPELLC